MGAQELFSWLAANERLEESKTTCQTWLTTEWSSAARLLLSTQAVVTALGDRLRLAQYESCFGDEAAAGALAQDLAEGQPVYEVQGQLCRQ